MSKGDRYVVSSHSVWGSDIRFAVILRRTKNYENSHSRLGWYWFDCAYCIRTCELSCVGIHLRLVHVKRVLVGCYDFGKGEYLGVGGDVFDVCFELRESVLEVGVLRG